MTHELGDAEDDQPEGSLVEAPLLRQVTPGVQVDLLADTWRRLQAAELHKATLLDAVVIYSACRTAGRIVHDEPTLARKWLKPGPRSVRCRLTARTPERLEEMFLEFWDDVDFLSLTELQDLMPEHARIVRELMHLPTWEIEQIEEVLSRCRALPAVLTNLTGLLIEKEMHDFAHLILGSRAS